MAARTATVQTLQDGSGFTLLPQGACDTHHHIFEPDVFPYSEERHLTPPPAGIPAYERFKTTLGITKSVLTHGLSYGDDCTSLKAFTHQLGARRTSAIGVIDPETTTDAELLSMVASGVRGLRVNLYRYRAMEDVELQKKALLAHVERITKLSLPWSLTLTTICTGFWDELAPFIRTHVAPTGVRVVTDHFGLLKAPSMLAAEYQNDPTMQPGFKSIMKLIKEGHLWVKLSAPYRVSEKAPGYSDLKSLVGAFVDSNKHRIVWGSDWPHTPRMKVRSREDAMKVTPYLEIDDEAWLRTLKSWLSDEEWHLLMVENPRVLFGFGLADSNSDSDPRRNGTN